jgi:hypothetical protein
VENLLKTGRLQVLEFSSNVNLAQIVWGWLACLPFGFSFTALQISTWLLAIAGLCGLYHLLRDLDVPRGDALLGVATMGAYPVFAVLGVTFMTDVPFVSLTILATAAMVRALQRSSTRWLAAASLAASVSVAIRAVGIVTPVAMLLAMVFRADGWGRRRARWAISLLPVVVAVGLIYWRQTHLFRSAELTWIKGTPEDRVAMLRFALPLLPQMSAETIGLIAGPLGLSVLPLALASFRTDWFRPVAGVFIGLVLLLTLFRGLGLDPRPLVSGQTWSLNQVGGSMPLVPDWHETDPPGWIFWAALAAGAFSCSVVLVRAWRAAGKPEHGFLVLAAAGHALVIALLWLIADRYVLVLVPYAIAVLLSAGRLPRRWPAFALLAVFGLVAAAGIRDQLNYNRAVWEMVDALGRHGVATRDINGGYMVNGWLQYAHPEDAHRDSAGNIDVPWVNGADELPYKIANEPASGWQVVESVGYPRWLAPPGRIYALKSTNQSRDGDRSR